ncbi:Assimilatory ferredoxin-dependent nitrite reductase [uncultured archaeon]|nr:Assimilatory ferredoxin-dependent nitrite reductase [uncultured archaeon]
MQKDDDFFAVRLRLPGGCISSDRLLSVAAVAKKYGRGLVRLTVRQGLEIPWIEFNKIEAARRDLEEADLTLGACGPRFRAVTACPGSSICRQGIVDSQNIALKIDRKFGGELLPHKFKATVSGCPNGCSRPLENEIGLCGIVQPKLDAEACISCNLCADICKEKALSLQDGKPVHDLNRCVHCGDCIQSCPTDAWKAEKIGYAVFAGGKMGRHPKLGEKIADFVNEEQVLEIISRSLDLYFKHGNKRERFSDLIDRVGVERFKSAVLEHEASYRSGL